MDYAIAAVNMLMLGLCVSLTECSLKRLGEHTPPLKGPTMLGGKFPPPQVLFYHFVSESSPLLMKGVLNDTSFPAFKKWTDDYLRSHYGGEILRAEVGKKEDRSGDKVPITLSRFLDIYTSSDVYLISSLPPAMYDDVTVPYSLRCGGFQHSLLDVVMWLSSGDTSSVLHRDDVDNINCLLDGEKQIVMYDKQHHKVIEGQDWVEEGSYSGLDVTAVDPEQFPGIYNAPWLQVNMVAGDCVYIPNRWYHHVYSPPGRNLAINFWFTPQHWVNASDCENVKRKNEPLRNFQKASPNQKLRSDFLSRFRGSKGVDEPTFIAASDCDEDTTKQLWDIFNSDGNQHISWEEFYRVDFDDLLQSYSSCFIPDPDKATDNSKETAREYDSYTVGEGGEVETNTDSTLRVDAIRVEKVENDRSETTGSDSNVENVEIEKNEPEQLGDADIRKEKLDNEDIRIVQVETVTDTSNVVSAEIKQVENNGYHGDQVIDDRGRDVVLDIDTKVEIKVEQENVELDNRSGEKKAPSTHDEF